MYSLVKILKKDFLIYLKKIIFLQNLFVKKHSVLILNYIFFLNIKNLNSKNLKKIFFICRIIKKGKKKIKIIKFKRRKNYKKIKNFNNIYNKILIKNINFNLK